MSREREEELVAKIEVYRHTELFLAFKELLQVRRERCRDKLESGENPEIRGRAKECKDLLQYFS